MSKYFIYFFGDEAYQVLFGGQAFCNENLGQRFRFIPKIPHFPYAHFFFFALTCRFSQFSHHEQPPPRPLYPQSGRARCWRYRPPDRCQNSLPLQSSFLPACGYPFWCLGPFTEKKTEGCGGMHALNITFWAPIEKKTASLAPGTAVG